MSSGRQGDGHPLARILLGALFLITVFLVTAALIGKSIDGAAGSRARYLASGCILAVGIGAFAIAGLVAARRKRALTAALGQDTPIRLSPSGIRLRLVALGLLLIAAGGAVAVSDPTIGLGDRIGAACVALVTGALGLTGLFATIRKVSPLAIGSEGMAYPAIWQGTIPWECVCDARLLTRLSTRSVYVVLAFDPATMCPLTPNYRRIAQTLKLQDSERPIPGDSFGVAPETLLARIKRSLDAADPSRPADPEGIGEGRPQFLDDREEVNRKYGDGLTPRQRADAVFCCLVFVLIFLPTDVLLWRWAEATPGVDLHAAIAWLTIIAIIIGALLTRLLLAVKRRFR
jgi:hypothetical protein